MGSELMKLYWEWRPARIHTPRAGHLGSCIPPSTDTTVHVCTCQQPFPSLAHTHAHRHLSRVLFWLSRAVRSGEHCLPPGFPTASMCALFKLPSASLHIGGPYSSSSLRCGYFVHESRDSHLGGITFGNSNFSFHKAPSCFMNLTSPSFSALKIQGPLGQTRKVSQWLPGLWWVGAQAPCPLSCPKLSPDLTNILW